MKIKELIDKLKTFDQESKVVVDGYGFKRGCEEPYKIEETSIIENYNHQDYHGKHEEMSFSNNKTTKVVIIRRRIFKI